MTLAVTTTVLLGSGGLAAAMPLPMTASDGPAATELSIPTIQGNRHLSPYDGQQVETTGYVTASTAQGYWIQDPEGDGNDSTSDAIYVYTGSTGTRPDVGSSVRVTGQVSDYRPGSKNGPDLSVTEISTSSYASLDTPLPAPKPVLLGPGGRQAPAEKADAAATRIDVESSSAQFQPKRDAVDFYETLEGMLVQVHDASVVGPTNSYGEMVVLPGGDAGTPRTGRGGALYASYDFPNTRRLTLEEGAFDGSMPEANVGDTLTGDVTGPLTYDFDTVRIAPTTEPTVHDGGLRKETTKGAGSGQLEIGAFNVENLSPKDPDSKFSALAKTIVQNLAAPDIVAVEEVQDNTGPECPNGPTSTCKSDGVVAADQTLDQLTKAISSAGGPAYAWKQISPVNLADGGQPTGNIRSAFLYRADRGLAFVDRAGGDATTATQVVGTGSDTHLSLSPGRIAPTDDAWKDSRKPLAGEFTWNGERLFVIADHFDSKGGDEPLMGRWQPPTRSSETQRHAQATVEHAFVADLLKADPNANVVVLGDLNDFDFSQTTSILSGSGKDLTSLYTTLPRAERYSYDFEGNSQVLDQMLVSKAAAQQVKSYDIVHVNAEFADQVSDHDPQVAVFGAR